MKVAQNKSDVIQMRDEWERKPLKKIDNHSSSLTSYANFLSDFLYLPYELHYQQYQLT